MAAFATFNDLRARFDERVIAKYASNTTVPIPPSALPTNPRVTTALLDATGLIVSACVKGRRYPRATLDALALDADKGSLLRQMTCVLAMGAIVSNRVGGVDDIEEVVHGYKTSLENLNELRNGSLVFDLDATLEATLPHSSAGPRFPDLNRPTNYNPIFGRFERRY